MIRLDDELAEEYLEECRAHLATIETELVSIKKGGVDIDGDCVNRVYEAVHAIKDGASAFELSKIGELARQTEEVVKSIRNGGLVPSEDRIDVLLLAVDALNGLVLSPETSNDADISRSLDALAGECAVKATAETKADPGGKKLRILLVEDDFASRLLLQTFLSRYGECHIAVNGREAVEAFHSAIESGQRYDLICMDIMMPEMDGREAVRRVRTLEAENGILSTFGAKIIMTTAVDDIKDVSLCYQELCDGYLVKPIDLAKLVDKMKDFQLVA